MLTALALHVGVMAHVDRSALLGAPGAVVGREEGWIRWRHGGPPRGEEPLTDAEPRRRPPEEA